MLTGLTPVIGRQGVTWHLEKAVAGSGPVSLVLFFDRTPFHGYSRFLGIGWRQIEAYRRRKIGSHARVRTLILFCFHLFIFFVMDLVVVGFIQK